MGRVVRTPATSHNMSKTDDDLSSSSKVVNDGYFVLADGPTGRAEEGRVRAPTSTDLARVAKSRKRNIKLMMQFTLYGTVVFSIIQWNIFDAYLSVLAKSKGVEYVNSYVGAAESIGGLTSIVLALPIGILVDNYSRTMTLKVTAVLGILASIVSFFGFMYDAMILLYANLFLWGVYSQASCSASEAIFADSIPTGNRSKYFSDKGVLERVSLSLGPGIMIILFYISGDRWTLQQLHIPLLLGCILAPIPCVLLFMFRDPHPEIDLPEAVPTPYSSAIQPITQKILVTSPMTVREQLTSASPMMPFTGGETSEEEMTAEEAWFKNMSWGELWIPYIVSFSDFIRKIGAGMTIKFFPLFFIYDFGFRPVHINMLFCVYPICMGIATIVLKYVADFLGRSQSALIFQLSGVLFLIGMYYLENVWLMVIFFILRGSFQNASYPLDKSIIMDYVPSNRRGLWNAVESVTSMTWSGSAVLGGMLSDFHDYRYTFLLTATIYLFASAVYVPLLWLVPRNEKGLLKQRRKMAVRKTTVPAVPKTQQNFSEDLSMPLAWNKKNDENVSDNTSMVMIMEVDDVFMDIDETPLLSTFSKLPKDDEKQIIT